MGPLGKGITETSSALVERLRPRVEVGAAAVKDRLSRAAGQQHLYNSTEGAKAGAASGDAFLADALEGYQRAADILGVPSSVVRAVTKQKVLYATPRVTLPDGSVVRARYVRAVQDLPAGQLPEALERPLTGGGSRADRLTTSKTVQGLAEEMTKKNVIYGLTQDVDGQAAQVLGAKGNWQSVTVIKPGAGSSFKAGQEVPFEKLDLESQRAVVHGTLGAMPEGHFGPRADMTAGDINTGTAQMDMIAEVLPVGAVRGNSVRYLDDSGAIDPTGGIINRGPATGLGAFHTTALRMKDVGLPITGSVQKMQGFGAAARPYAEEMAQNGAKFTAIMDGYVNEANEFVPVVLKNADGIDIAELGKHRDAHGSIRGFSHGGTESLEGEAAEQFWSLPADVLVAGAKENQLTVARTQLSQEAATPSGQKQMLVEIANNPVTADAKPLWEEHPVVPDFLANGTGSAISNQQVKQNTRGVAFTEAEVARDTQALAEAAYQRIDQVAKEHGISYRDAGDVLALSHLMELYGIDPARANSLGWTPVKVAGAVGAGAGLVGGAAIVAKE